MRWLVLAAMLAGCPSRAKPPRQVSEPGDVADLDIAEPAPEPEAPAAPPPRAAPPRPEPPAARRGPRRYRGRPIDLDVRDADLVAVFRLLSTAGGVNLVLAPEVRGKVTLRLHQVPWDQAMAVIARAYQLVIERDGAVYLVKPRTAK